MRFKSVAAVALSTALIMGGTSGVANAQQAVSPSSMIEIPQEFVTTVQNFLPGTSYADAEAALQSTAGSIALNSTAGFILPILIPALGLGTVGSVALSS